MLGLRDNGHLSYLGRELKRHGLEIRRNFVVRDNAEDIQQVFKNAWEDADIIITTGGLGPTSDDLTRETIAKALGVKLEFVDSVRVELEARFARLGRTVTANNLKQCYVLDGAEALPNPNGTAPGILFKQDGKLLIMLPGPGNELRPMFERDVLPDFRKKISLLWRSSTFSYALSVWVNLCLKINCAQF